MKGKKGITVGTLISAIILAVILIIVVGMVILLSKNNISLGEYIQNLFRFGGK